MKKIVLVILLVLVTAGIGLLLYMLLTRTTPVYAGSNSEIISDGSSFAVSASYYSGLDKTEVETALLDVQDGVEGALTAYDAILARALRYSTLHSALHYPTTEQVIFPYRDMQKMYRLTVKSR